jgi:ATP-dependent DNA ligase
MNIKVRNKKVNKKGEIISCDFIDLDTGELISPLFSKYKSIEDYKRANVRFITPMCAKEYQDEDMLNEMLDSEDYMQEEKLDGTRATMHIGSQYSRIFSRRISKKTGWFVENSDSLPQLREVALPEFNDTIIDGEMRIDGKDFKEVESTLNCLWNTAILRQLDWGFITLHTFDVIYYKGVFVGHMPLYKRKELLKKVVTAIDSKYVKEVPYTKNIVKKLSINFLKTLEPLYTRDKMGFKIKYPNLYKLLNTMLSYEVLAEYTTLDKRAYHEYIIACGGEGTMLKSIYGKYHFKRGREYTKWKKHITRECIIIGFASPTHFYKITGKSKTWDYWENEKYNNIMTEKTMTFKKANKLGLIPITKSWYKSWVEKIRFGVIITKEELNTWEKINKGKKKATLEYINNQIVLEVGQCAGMNEVQKEFYSEHQKDTIGLVIEVEANEIFNDTGFLRHPRYVKRRIDKYMEDCTWYNHMNQ